MLPEKMVVEGGAGVREARTLMALGDAALRPALPIPIARVEPVLRLVNAAPASSPPVAPAFTPPAETEPAPIRLTAAVTPPQDDTAVEHWSGAALRRVRESRGLDLSQLAERTKVTRHHLENIEADRYDRLPSYVYLRGILLSAAKELRLDAQKVCRSYLELAEAASEGGSR